MFTKKQNVIIGAVVVALVLCGASFYAGASYARGNDRPGDPEGFGQGMGQMRGGLEGGRTMQGAPRGGMGGGMTMGSVIAKDATSITIELPDGGSRIVLITDATPVAKSTTGTLADIVVGEQVQVMGTSNADGSISARSIQIGSPVTP